MNFDKTLSEFVVISNKKYKSHNGTNSYAYSSAYFQSVLAHMFLDLPEHRQQFFHEFLKGKLNQLKELPDA